MRYHIQIPPVAEIARQQDELGRLLRHAKAFTVTFVTVGPPHRSRAQTMCLVELPDRFIEQFERVMAILSGRDDAATQTNHQVKARPEWTATAELHASTDARPLDGLVLAGASSAMLTVAYTARGTTATLQYSSQDSHLLERLKDLGWSVRPQATGLGRLLPRPASASVAPSLAWSIPAPAPAPAQGAETRVSVPVPVSVSAPVSQPSSPLLAAPGAPGFLLGTGNDGAGVHCAWQNHVLSLVAPPDRTRTALLALVGRALGQGMAVVVHAGRDILRDNALAPFASRMRLLDGLDLWESAAIPWSEMAPDMLSGVLARHGLAGELPWPPPEYFAELLAQFGGSRLATQPVLGLTAPPGDDLRGVVAAGGGVALLDDGDAGSTLLADLLMACLASPPRLERPILMLRRAGVLVPRALAEQSIQIVLDYESTAAATLTSIPPSDGWRLTFADRSAPVELLADLTSVPLSADADYHQRIITGLSGHDAPVADEDGDGEWYAGSPLEQLADQPGEVAIEAQEQPIEQARQGEPASAGDEWEVLAAAALVPDEPVIEAEAAPVELVAPGESTSAGDEWEVLAAAALEPDQPAIETQEQPIEQAAPGESTSGGDEWEVLAAAALVPDEPAIEAEAVPDESTSAGSEWEALEATDPETERRLLIEQAIEQAMAEELAAAALEPDESTIEADAELVERAAPGEPASGGDEWEVLAAAALEPDELAIEAEAAPVEVAAPVELIAPDEWTDVPGLLPVDSMDVDLFGSGSTPNRGMSRSPLGRQRRGFVMRRPAITRLDAVEAHEPATELPQEPAPHDQGMWEPAQDTQPTARVAEAPQEPDVWEPAAPEALASAVNGQLHQGPEASAALVSPLHAAPMAVPAVTVGLGDAELIASWRDGTPMPELVRRMQEADPGTSRDLLRARLRTLLAAAPASVPGVALVVSTAAASLPGISMPPSVHAEPGAGLAEGAGQTEDAPDAIWAEWMRDVPLEDMIKARCGFTRGVAANRVRDRIYRVVIPRIVTDLQAEELISRLCEDRKPLKAQAELYETLLRRVVRQSRPVTGSLQEAIHERIVSVMQSMQPVRV